MLAVIFVDALAPYSVQLLAGRPSLALQGWAPQTTEKAGLVPGLGCPAAFLIDLSLYGQAGGC